MLRLLATAAKAAGLTYRLMASTTMIGLLAYGTYEFIKRERLK